MKKLLIGTALAVVLGSAAFAQSYNRISARPISRRSRAALEQGYGAYAQQEPTAFSQRAHASRVELLRNQPCGVSGGEGWYSQDSG